MQDTNTFRFKLQLAMRTGLRLVTLIRKQRISQVDNRMNGVITTLENLLSAEEMKPYTGVVLENFQAVLECYAGRDFLLMADYMENGVLAILQQIAEGLVSALPLPEVPDGYQVEYTASAMTTIAKQCGDKVFYLHGNGCPMQEAHEVVREWMEVGVNHYIVAGLGLGYHVGVLAFNPLIQVDVYEEDETMIALCKEWSDIPGMIHNLKRINIIHDPGYQKFAKAASLAEQHKDTEKVCLYHPSIQSIRDENLRVKMYDILIQTDNAKRWENNMAINFLYNTSHIEKEVSELTDRFVDKTVYLVAGGPSLDNNISLLKDRHADSLVVTVGTSLKCCLSHNVNPDFVMITDPKDDVYRQIEGLEECSVPMILLSTAYMPVTRDYKGDKYIAFQQGYQRAEEMAQEKGCPVFETGGSVMTTALDMCIRLGAKRIVFLGLDLAFTGGKSHHDMAEGKLSVETELYVQDVYGNPVSTSKNLSLYREWIERRIANEPKGIEFFDATEGGAKVEGTKVVRLADIIEN